MVPVAVVPVAGPGPEPVTVLSVLENPVVSRGGPEVLAGGDNLLRRVRWVHISDQTDIAAYLRGGEVLLTSGTGFPTGDEAVRGYVASLAEAGLAALVVRAEKRADTVPSAMVAEAAERGLPLIRLNHRIGFAEVTRTLHERLLDAELGFLRRADQLRGELMRLLVDQRPLAELVEQVAEALGRAVLVEDPSGRVVSMRWPGHDEDELLELWSRRADAAVEPVRGTSVHAGPGAAWTTLQVRGAPWGRLLTLDYGPTPSEDAAGLLAVGAAVLNLAIAQEADGAPVGAETALSRACDEVVAGLVTASGTPEQRLRRRAASLGLRLTGGQVTGFAVRRRGAPGRELRGRVERLLRSSSPGALVGVHDDRVVGVLESDDAEGMVRALVDELNTADAGGWAIGRPVVAGLSTRAPLAEAGRALREAMAAADHAVEHPDGATPDGAVQRYGDLGLHRLLAHLADSGRLTGYVRAELGPLLDHDRDSRSPLVETLRAYLASNSRATETAQALFIERRTLYHRLRTVAELLGCDLNDHDTRVRIGVALAGLSVLQARANALPRG